MKMQFCVTKTMTQFWKNMMKYIVNCKQNMVKYIIIGEMPDKKMTIFYMTKCSDNSRHFFWLSLPLPS